LADIYIYLNTFLPDVWRRGEVYTEFWWKNLRERDHMEDPGVDDKTILIWIFRKGDVGYVLD